MKIMTVPVIIIIVMMMNMRIFATDGGFAKRGVGQNGQQAVQSTVQKSTILANVVMCKPVVASSTMVSVTVQKSTILASVLMFK